MEYTDLAKRSWAQIFQGGIYWSGRQSYPSWTSILMPSLRCKRRFKYRVINRGLWPQTFVWISMTEFWEAASPASIVHWHQLKEKAITRLKSQRTRAQNGHSEHGPKGRTYGKSHIIISGLPATSFIIFSSIPCSVEQKPKWKPRATILWSNHWKIPNN